jgi:hypothetical protein
MLQKVVMDLEAGCSWWASLITQNTLDIHKMPGYKIITGLLVCKNTKTSWLHSG